MLPSEAEGDTVYVMTEEPPEKVRSFAEEYIAASCTWEKRTAGSFIPVIEPKNLREDPFGGKSYWCQVLDADGRTVEFVAVHRSFGGELGAARGTPNYSLFRFAGLSSEEKPITLFRQKGMLYVVCDGYAYFFLETISGGKIDEMNLRGHDLQVAEIRR